MAKKKAWGFEGVYDGRVDAFFRENRIFLKHPFKFRGVFNKGDLIQIHPKVKVERYASLPPRQFISMGAFSYCISTVLKPGVTIGRYCSIATNVRLMGDSHPTDRVSTHVFSYRPYAAELAMQDFGKTPDIVPHPDRITPVTIGHDVWIGQDVLIKQGVDIGTGAIIAAGAVVTQNVEPYTIVGGVPARIIRRRFAAPLAERLLASEWWRYNYADFSGLSINQPEKFVDQLYDQVSNSAIRPFEPGVLTLGAALTAYLAERPLP